MSLPKHFCWTRFGTEAGETIDRILERKESERQRNGGIFLWGIGNAIGPSMRELLRVERTPEVIFSPIRSNPKREDAQPSTVIAWRAGRDLDGRPRVSCKYARRPQRSCKANRRRGASPIRHRFRIEWQAGLAPDRRPRARQGPRGAGPEWIFRGAISPDFGLRED